MTGIWQKTYNSMLRNCARDSRQREFQTLRAKYPNHVFVAPCSAFICWLQTSNDRPIFKNEVLAILVIEAQGNSATASLAQDLIFLALWPRLDGLRFRLRRLIGCTMDEIEGAILGEFVLQIRKAQIGRIRLVAATLILNVERDIKRPWFAEEARRRMSQSLETCDLADTSISDTWSEASAVTLGTGSASRYLCSCLGRTEVRDADLIYLTGIVGHSAKEAAQMMGITYAAARKRLCRTLPVLAAKKIF